MCVIVERNDGSKTEGGRRIPLFVVNCGTM
jgi:hypothetical protein